MAPSQRLPGIRIGEASFTSWTERQRQERQTHQQNLQFPRHDHVSVHCLPLSLPANTRNTIWLSFPRSARSLAALLVMERRPSAGPRSNDSRHTWRCTAPVGPGHAVPDAFPPSTIWSPTSQSDPHVPTHHLNEVLSSTVSLRTHNPEAAEEAWGRCFLAALS